jgi:hypothetical protein
MQGALKNKQDQHDLQGHHRVLASGRSDKTSICLSRGMSQPKLRSSAWDDDRRRDMTGRDLVQSQHGGNASPC